MRVNTETRLDDMAVDEDAALLDDFHSEYFTVTIRYILRAPTQGAFFQVPSDDPSLSLSPFPFMYAFGQGDLARYWMPCVDSKSENVSWVLHIITPRYLSDAVPERLHSIFEPEELQQEILVVCSGQLEEQCLLHNERQKLFQYSCRTPIPASTIMLAVGPFEICRIPGWETRLSAQGPAKDVENVVPDQDDDQLSQEEGEEGN